mmetsp:Transcript_35246/g.85295  ORF Transcript_35246/g.85295 Transcript_35246/m.85295 type:complete len:129 (+) Transcript_35246:148-534(+)|eukprot:CAMPEP_0113468698 /NCGR_PEP_ID=MMETSP0014_2-20120614/15496_1 /TAXON_ID=2857 /ORGANISM="Nitzschia sp." /LENGTH=128 /DNA_ID=CAMNT_0000361109 /DNA_START=69 /DNA_END=455 /DNA_ORIENTATION=- /assembly_acc=CAM_ASM_000159
MGNCLGGGDAGAASTTTTTTTTTRPNKSNKAFQGTGHRLGAAHEEEERAKAEAEARMVNKNQPDVPEPRVDPSLSDSARDRQREERLKAAEERQNKLGGGTQTKKKKKDTTDEPLRGPNSQPTMRWTA